MAHRALEVGSEVMAKWPGSDRYFEAIVQEEMRGTFVVLFTDGGGYEAKVPKGHVYTRDYFRRRSRSSSPARQVRSRSRSRSPARKTRGRSKSPARSQSPGRRGRPRKSVSPAAPKTPKASEEKRLTRSTPQRSTRTPTQQRQSRSISRRTPERKVEIHMESMTSSSSRITRSFTKKLVSEEKETLLATESMKEKKPRGKSYEFGGPVGALFTMLGLPVLVFALNLLCGQGAPCILKRWPKLPPLWAKTGAFFDYGHLIVDGWIAFQAVLYMLPIGKVVKGRMLADGSQLEYRLNGFLALMLSVAGLVGLLYYKVSVAIVYKSFIGMITASIIWAIVIAVGLYVKGRCQKTGLAPGGNTGNVVYDFFMGHQLNPRIGSFDFKFFFEVRPGLIGWVMLNFCMAALEYQKQGHLSASMILVCAFQFLYVGDCLLFESAILTTYDILDEGFGFMLAFGDLTWVPFLYSLQAHFLLEHPVKLSWPAIVGIVLLKAIGYVIFRGSNGQKDRFRTDPHTAEFQNAETILTATGRQLLVSGWWGLVRHPNYLGDILMALSWSLTCGFTHLIPYFYPIYLTCLLVHREFRDEAHNRRKYDASWEDYCRRVPYRIIPKVF